MRTSDPQRPEAEQRHPPPTSPSAEWPSWPRLGAPITERDWGSRRHRMSLAKSAGIVAGSFIISRLLGLMREIVLARQFGTSEAFSAYVSAFRIPDLLFLVVMAGAFGSAFIPIFSGFLADGEDEAAWKLASVVLNISGVFVVVAAAVTWVFAPEIVRYVVAPEASSAARQITVDCMRILLLSPIFLGFGIAAKGILEGQDLFTLPALAPIVYNAATILGAILLGPRIGVYGVAIGVVAGAIGFLLLEIPGLVRSGMHYSISFDPRTPGVNGVGRLLAPRLIGQAAFQLNFIAVTNLAWRTGEQSVSALNYAWQLLMLPHGILALSVSTVILPTLSRLWQAGDTVAFRATLGNALRPLLFLSLPAAVVLFTFRLPIVQTLFQTGAFSAESTNLVAAPLAFLAAGLVSYAMVEALARAFYAMHDTRTPVVAGIGIMVLNVLIGVALLDRLGYLALALALSLSTTVEAIILIAVLGRRIGTVSTSTRDWLLRVIAASAVAALVAVLLASPLIEATTPGSGPKLQQVVVFLLALGVVAIVYLGCAWILRIPELSDFLALLARRIPPLRRLAIPARR
jgi:putative peptidoglycan lipid II flippase